MKREIKFRGICNEEIHTYHEATEVGEFIDGYLVSHNTIATEMSCESGGVGSGLVVAHVEVIPETVGQYTGLKDKNGKEIYEGDIVELVDVVVKGKLFEIRFEKGSFVAYYAIDKNIVNIKWGLISRFEELDWDVRVIGNIHE